jgi:hypothetical protein
MQAFFYVRTNALLLRAGLHGARSGIPPVIDFKDKWPRKHTEEHGMLMNGSVLFPWPLTSG